MKYWNEKPTRHARTLQEAFGPYTSRDICEPHEPMAKSDALVLWACAVALAVVAAMVWAGVIVA